MPTPEELQSARDFYLKHGYYFPRLGVEIVCQDSGSVFEEAVDLACRFAAQRGAEPPLLGALPPESSPWQIGTVVGENNEPIEPQTGGGDAAWKCKANPTSDPPQDCGWPTCGCDPHADKVIAALEETGAVASPRLVGDLAMLVKRLIRRVRKSNADDPVALGAFDFLARHDLLGSPLRDDSETGGGDAPLSPEAIAHLDAEVDAGGSIGPDDVERAAAAYPTGGGDAGERARAIAEKWLLPTMWHPASIHDRVDECAKDITAALCDSHREGATAMREAAAQIADIPASDSRADVAGTAKYIRDAIRANPIPGKTDAH